MDKICDFIDRMAEWMSTSSRIPICYAALQRTRSFNRPAPLAGFLYQASGDFGEWTVGGKPWLFPVNHLSVGCCHKGSASPFPVHPVELWAVAFNLEGIPAFDDLWDAPVRGKTLVSDPASLTSTFQKTARLFIDRDNTDPLCLKAAVLELFAAARREFSQIKPKRHAAVDRAIDWMSRHFHEPEIKLTDVANAAGLSPHHFGRIFTRATGESTMQYLRKLRIRHSCGLLQGTTLRVNEIAFAVGFNDPLHFSRVFHQHTGKSPRDFRSEKPAASSMFQSGL